MSTAPGSTFRQVRSNKKLYHHRDLHHQISHRKNFISPSSRAVMDKLEDKKDDQCSEHNVLLHGTKAEKPKIATSQSNGSRPFRIIGGDPFVPGTDNYKRMVAQRRLLYERGQNGGVFCKGNPCSPDNFLKTVAGNCYGPYKRASFADSWP